ncbi:MAG: type II toxin-antitoxin system VapC family toxin [Magnetococcales bacterium]|nr:type II toxin-antitoxin system VapC family toxin [Magnetococcales bacterium]
MMQLIYLDSCIVIYLVERHVRYFPLIRQALSSRAEAVLSVSPLVMLEVLVRPVRQRNELLVTRFQRYLSTQRQLPLLDPIFTIALDLRAHHGLKTPDALHLATAMHHGCTEFWTNDERLADVAPNLAVNVLVHQ